MTDSTASMMMFGLAVSAVLGSAFMARSQKVSANGRSAFEYGLAGAGILAGLVMVMGFAGHSGFAGVWAVPAGALLSNALLRLPYFYDTRRLWMGQRWAWAALAAACVVAFFIPSGVAWGWLFGVALSGYAAFQKGSAARENARAINSIAPSLAAVLGVTAERIWESQPRFYKENGVIYIARPAAVTLGRLDSLNDLCAAVMPEYEIVRADAGAVVFSPVSVEEASKRRLAAESGGLIVGLK